MYVYNIDYIAKLWHEFHKFTMEKQSSADEFQVSVDKFSHLLKSQPPKLYLDSWRHRRRQIQKVPPQIRRRMRRNEQVYDPVMVSLGPYHHGKAELLRSEEFKHLCLDWRGGGDEQKKALFYSKILSEIDAIRDSYAEVEVVKKYDDESLALMMLLDGSMIVDFMLNFIGVKESSSMSWQICLGAGSGPLMSRDMMVMENQIPYRVVQTLIRLQYEEEEEAASILPRFMNHKMGVELDHAAIPQEKEDPPIHLLEAFWRVLVNNRRRHTSPGNSNGFMLSELLQEREDQKHRDRYDVSYTPRSVMDLKAKGIRVRPNSTLLLRDMAFRPSNGCFSHLHLPLLCISDQTSVIWANMIAYEVLPNRCTSLAYLSYAIFMKSLIQSPEDVKELQERGLMSNRTANLERVVEFFKEIDTFGLHEQDIFKDVKREIEEHCNSRAKTWLAELIYTRFRTPWTSIALFAAVLLLCLTFLQTFYTIRR